MNLEWITIFLTFFLGFTFGILIQRYLLDKSSRAAKLESELVNLKNTHCALIERVDLHRTTSMDLIEDFQTKADLLARHYEELLLEKPKGLPSSIKNRPVAKNSFSEKNNSASKNQPTAEAKPSAKVQPK